MKYKKILILLVTMMTLLFACQVITETGDENVEPVDEKYKTIQIPVITSEQLIVK